MWRANFAVISVSVYAATTCFAKHTELDDLLAIINMAIVGLNFGIGLKGCLMEVFRK